MSGQATGWVLRHGPKNRAMRAVLLTIADAANRDGDNARPGLQAVIDGSLYKRSQVMAVTKKLLAEGWLEITESAAPGRAVTYRVPLVDRVQETDASQVRSEPDVTEAVTGPNDPGQGSETEGSRVQTSVPETSYRDSPTVKPTVETNKPAARKEIELALAGVCGLSVPRMTSPEKRKLGLAANTLYEVGASVEEISRRARIYRREWRGASLTPMGMANNWGQLDTLGAVVHEPKGFDGIRDFVEAVGE